MPMPAANLPPAPARREAFPPKEVMRLLRDHDARMKDEREHFNMITQTYATRFWRWVEKVNGAEGKKKGGRAYGKLETNKLAPEIANYLAALYPQHVDVTLTKDATSTGDPEKASLFVSKKINAASMRRRILSGAAQGLLYGAAGAKVGFDRGTDPVMGRVWVRAFPVWELLLDRDVHDEEDARYIGHVSMKPCHEVEELYGVNVKGEARLDYLSGEQDSRTKQKNTPDDGNADDGFVRVLELCNLVDTYTDPTTGITYKGRLEVWLPNQEGGQIEPAYVGALPMLGPDGKGMSHIIPLIFTCEEPYPLRPLAYASRLMPQQIELNVLRDHMLGSAKRDSRKFLAKKNTLDSTASEQLVNGEDGSILMVSEGYDGPLEQVIVPLQHAPISTNLREAVATVQADLESLKTAPTATLGFIKNVTAEAVRATIGHTESEYGRHAEAIDEWLRGIIRGMLAAAAAAMRDTGLDSEGGDTTPGSPGNLILAADASAYAEGTDPKLAAQVRQMDARKDSAPTEEEELEAAIDDEVSEQEQEMGSAIIEANERTVQVDAERETPEEEAREGEACISLLGEGDVLVKVYADDLDSSFDIGFSDVGRSPIGSIERRESLNKLLPTLMELFKKLIAGGPESAFAAIAIDALVQSHKLGPQFSSASLLAAAQKAADTPPVKAARAKPAGPGGPGAPEAAPPGAEEEAPAPGGGDNAELLATLDEVEELANTDPAAAVEALAAILTEQEAANLNQQLGGLTPDQQAPALLQIVAALRQQLGA